MAARDLKMVELLPGTLLQPECSAHDSGRVAKAKLEANLGNSVALILRWRINFPLHKNDTTAVLIEPMNSNRELYLQNFCRI